MLGFGFFFWENVRVWKLERMAPLLETELAKTEQESLQRHSIKIKKNKKTEQGDGEAPALIGQNMNTSLVGFGPVR